MLQKKRTKNYPFQQSILYNLKSKNKLAKLLNISLKDLKVIQGDEHYSCFVVSGGRSIQHPLDDLYKVPLYTTNFTEPLSYQGSAFLKLPKFP